MLNKLRNRRLREKRKDNQRARIGSFNFTQPNSEGGNHPQFYPKSSVPTPSSAIAPVLIFKIVISIERQGLNIG